MAPVRAPLPPPPRPRPPRRRRRFGAPVGDADVRVTDVDPSGDAGSDVVLNDPAVSRRHAVIRRDERGFIISDLHSTSGSFINGQRFDEQQSVG